MALFTRESGPDTAPTIVFLHGGGCAGWMWQPQVEQLRDFHCLVPDLPEHGRSTGEVPFSTSGAAQRTAELIAARAHDGKAHVVGLSQGAQVAVALLAMAPERVDHAMISSALVRPMAGGSMMTPTLLSLAHRVLVQPFKNNNWWIRLNMKYAAGIPESFYSQFRESFRELTASGFANVMVENQRFRAPPGLHRVTAPTLIVVGSRERAVMRRSARDLAEAIPGAQAREVIHDRKMSLAEEHNWSMSTPALFTQTVRAWITHQPLPAALRPLCKGVLQTR